MKPSIRLALPFLAISAAVLGFRLGERREDEASSPQQSREEPGMSGKSVERSPVQDFPVQLEKISSIRDPDERGSALRELFQRWIGRCPEEAFRAWANTPGASDATGFEGPVGTLRSQLGFDRTLAVIRQLGEPGLRDACLQVLASRIHELEDPEAGVESLSKLEGELRRKFLPVALVSWSQRSGFDEIAGWLDAKRATLDSPEMAGLERAATVRLIESRPEEAARWLLGRADEGSRPGHLEHIAAIWARSTPNAAAEWLKQLAPGPGNDLAFAAFAKTVSEDDPQSAALWAAGIQDPGLRSETLSAALAAWAKLDPEAAAAFRAEVPR